MQGFCFTQINNKTNYGESSILINNEAEFCKGSITLI